MKACDDCSAHDGGCNWLDDKEVCPHCGGPLRSFRGSPAADLMDEMALVAEGLARISDGIDWATGWDELDEDRKQLIWANANEAERAQVTEQTGYQGPGEENVLTLERLGQAIDETNAELYEPGVPQPVTVQDLVDRCARAGIDPADAKLIHDTVGIGSGPVLVAEFDPDCVSILVVGTKAVEPLLKRPELAVNQRWVAAKPVEAGAPGYFFVVTGEQVTIVELWENMVRWVVSGPVAHRGGGAVGQMEVAEFLTRFFPERRRARWEQGQ